MSRNGDTRGLADRRQAQSSAGGTLGWIHRARWRVVSAPITSGCASFVAVVQSTNLGYCNHSSQLRWLNRPRFRRILLQGKMRPRLMIVGEIGRQGSAQGSFSEDDHMVQTLAEWNQSRAPRRPAATVIEERRALPQCSCPLPDLGRYRRKSYRDRAADSAGFDQTEMPRAVAVPSIRPWDAR